VAISLINSYFSVSPVNGIGGDSSSLSTTSFTPSNGEIIVVKATTWDTGTPSGTPSGGGLTYTRRATAAPGGFNPYATIFTAVVSGSPGSMSVTLSPPASSSYHSMCVERWAGAQLAATPATNAVIAGTTTMSTTIDTVAANSIVSWTAVDQSNQNPAGRVYLSSAVDEGVGDGHVNDNDVMYHAYQQAGAAGTQTMGISSPVITKWVLAGIEIQVAVATNAGGFMPFFN
jgi:hypothetical protein